MAVHGVLVQCDEQIVLVAGRADRLLAQAHREEDVPTPDDGLVSVVGLKMQAASHGNARQDVARRGNPLPCRASNTDSQAYVRHKRKQYLVCGARATIFRQIALGATIGWCSNR